MSHFLFIVINIHVIIDIIQNYVLKIKEQKQNTWHVSRFKYKSDMNTSDSGTRSEKLKCSNQQKVCTEEEEEEHLGMSVSLCGGHVGASAFMPHRKKRKKKPLRRIYSLHRLCDQTSRHLKTSRFTSWTVSENHQRGNSLKTLWHDDDVMERLGS